MRRSHSVLLSLLCSLLLKNKKKEERTEEKQEEEILLFLSVWSDRTFLQEGASCPSSKDKETERKREKERFFLGFDDRWVFSMSSVLFLTKRNEKEDEIKLPSLLPLERKIKKKRAAERDRDRRGGCRSSGWASFLGGNQIYHHWKTSREI